MRKISIDRMLQLRFDVRSFFFFILLLVVEVIIALFVKDRIIRPYGGDFLVVIMIYYFLKTFIKTQAKYLLIFVLLFAYAIEFAQLFNVVEVLGLQKSKLARIVIGTSFSWGDIVAYTLGVFSCYIIESGFLEKWIKRIKYHNK